LRQLAWGISFLTLALVTAATVLVVLNRDSIGNLYQANAVEIVLPISWAVLGGLVASAEMWRCGANR
jgi:hypothetical protein